MTYRDANANDLTDFFDLTAIAKRQPTFHELPALAAAGDTAARLACSTTGPGAIPPPPRSPTPAAPMPRLRLRVLGIRRPLHGLVVELRTDHGWLSELEVELHHGKRLVAHAWVHHLSVGERRVVLRVRGRIPAAGRYSVVVRRGRRVLARRAVLVG